MKAQIQITEGLQRKLNVEIPAEVVKASYERVYDSIKRNAEINGFRKGKAPLNKIKNLYKDRVGDDVANDLINEYYPVALKNIEPKVVPISFPEFEFDVPNEADHFSFSAVFEVRPEIVIKKIEGLSVLKQKLVVEPAKIDAHLQQLLESKASLVDVPADQTAKISDTAIIDFDGFVEGKPLEGGVGKSHQLELGAKQFIDGFEEGLVGMKVSEARTLNLKFPTPYHSEEIAGKDVEFKVVLVGLKTKVLPELNDAFINSIANGMNLEQYKEKIRSDFERQEQTQIENDFKRRLLDALVKANPVEVPVSLLLEQKKDMIADITKNITSQGMDEAFAKTYIERFDGDITKQASQRLCAGFLISQIAKDRGIACTEENFNSKLEEYAKQTGIDMARIVEFYSEPTRRANLEDNITEDMVVKFLTEKAVIKEVDAKDLPKDETSN